MILSIAWRNIWRNKKRSGVLICAIAFGLWAGLLSMGLMLGMVQQMIDSAIETRISHVQIHQTGFRSHKEIGLTIPAGEEVLTKVRNTPGVKFAAGRALIGGMASSPVTGAGVEVFGVNPEDETSITDLHEQVIEGTYFETKKRNPIIIGRKLAEKLEVDLGKKIVITAQSADGNIGAGAFRVVGIYKTVSSMFDETAIFARRSDIDRTFGLNGGLHEIAIIVEDAKTVNEIAAGIEADFPGSEVETWKELSPELGYMTESTGQMLYIFMVIILLALVFGITNTMLMGVLERVREIGVVMALGMKHSGIFAMIVIETICLAIIGLFIGLGLGAATMEILTRTGIDLSMVSAGLAAFGMSEMLYPFLPLIDYPKVAALVMITALVGAIYPGIRAIKLNPVEAIRTY